MRTMTIPLAFTLVACALAFAQSGLPARMHDKYKAPTGRSAGAPLELAKQESPDKARVRVNVTNMNDHGFACGFSPVDTGARRTDGGWKFSFPGRYCKAVWTMTASDAAGAATPK